MPKFAMRPTNDSRRRPDSTLPLQAPWLSRGKTHVLMQNRRAESESPNTRQNRRATLVNGL